MAERFTNSLKRNSYRYTSRRLLSCGLPVVTAWVLLAITLPGIARADELTLTVGGGPQPNSDQENKTVGVDYSFFEYERSARQLISIGVSYTYIDTNHESGDSGYAISIYPQLTFFPAKGGAWASIGPSGTTPYFFVRALGPSYLSEKRFGDREQEHFSFQAQFGAGLRFSMGNNRRGSVSMSWKHFSNAGLSGDNDGYDFPFVLSLGLEL